jgi:hypothetical protein
MPLSTFDTYTLDGDYVAKNFPNPQDIYIIRDTSDIFMISFAAGSKIRNSLRKYRPYRFKISRTALKIMQANDFLYKQGVLDPVKRVYFSTPARLRGGDSTEGQWQRVEARAAQIIQKIERSDVHPGWPLAVMICRLSLHARDFFRYRRALLRQRFSR